MLPVVLTVLGFLWWWPIGLILLALFVSRRRYGSWRHLAFAGDAPPVDWDHRRDHWEHRRDRFERKIVRMEEKMEIMRAKMDRVRGGGWFGPPTSGNRAFDEYRSETLRRLEDEQREFKDFLARLRFAKDRAEFDQFMADRRNRAGDETPPPQPQP